MSKNRLETLIAAQLNADGTPKLGRSEQSRINGAKSKGPTTPEGKSASSRSALKHGLTATVHTVLAFESGEAYDQHQEDWINNLRPADRVELRMVRQIANLQWRLERLAMMENALLNVELAANFEETIGRYAYIDDIGALAIAWRASSGKGNGLDLLRRYLNTLQHQFNSTFKNFEKLEARRRDPGRIRDLESGLPYQRPQVEMTPDIVEEDEEEEESSVNEEHSLNQETEEGNEPQQERQPEDEAIEKTANSQRKDQPTPIARIQDEPEASQASDSKPRFLPSSNPPAKEAA